MKERLPFDIWVVIAAYLSVECILSLSLVGVSSLSKQFPDD